MLGLEKESSLDIRREGSRNAGDGDSVGFGASLKERGFGDFRPWLNDDKEVGVRSPSSSLCVKADFALVEAACCPAMVVVDMVMRRKLWMWADEEVGGMFGCRDYMLGEDNVFKDSLSAHYVSPKEGWSLRWWGLDEREAAWPHAWHACIVLQLAPRGSPPDGHIDTGNHNSPTQITGGSTLYSLLRLSRETSSSSQFLGNDSTCYVCGWDLHGTCHSRLLGH